MKKLVVGILMAAMLVTLFSGCGSNKSEDVNPDLDTSEEVHLIIAGGQQDNKAMEHIMQQFSDKYPNCDIEYEYIQDYENAIATRLQSDTDKVDLFITNNIQQDSSVQPYALELYSQKNLDISDTYDGLITNFEYFMSDGEEIYSIPLGGELRGMYVNQTLLDSLGIDVPTNRQEFLNACQVVADYGYVALGGNPGNFAEMMLYPSICNKIANADNYEETYQEVETIQEGVSALFEDDMQLMYTMMEKNYYQYKYVETELGLYTDMTDEAVSRDFLNVLAAGDGYKKKDEIGQVAFMPGTLSLESVIDKTKEDYHSKIDYEFILSPVGEDGGYAYLSPGKGIAINKNSDHVDWSVEFMNFLFEEENNISFAKEAGYVPNTSEAMSYVENRFDIPKNHICQLGQVTFDYDFYNVINESLIEVSKGNNPKYMQEDGSLHDFSYYMNNMEQRFADIRTGDTQEEK